MTINTGRANTSFEFHGHIKKTISPKDKQVFQLTDDNLRQGVETLMKAKPDVVSIGEPNKDSTYWTDLYQNRKWSPVHRTLSPIRVNTLSIHSESVVVNKQRFANKLSEPTTYKAAISSDLVNTISSSWEQSHGIDVGTEITYKVNFNLGLKGVTDLDGEISNSNHITFTTTWGVSTSEEKSTTVGSSSEVSGELQPGQEVEAILIGSQGTMDIQVEYLSSLEGDVACKFSKSHNGRTLWRQDVNTVLAAIGMPIQIFSRQTLKIGVYFEARVIVVDANSREVLSEEPVAFAI